MTAETSLTPQIASRYRPIAGPFRSPAEWPVGEAIRAALGSARILIVAEPDGPAIHRLRSECETREQTTRRLRKLSLR